MAITGVRRTRSCDGDDHGRWVAGDDHAAHQSRTARAPRTKIRLRIGRSASLGCVGYGPWPGPARGRRTGSSPEASGLDLRAAAPRKLGQRHDPIHQIRDPPTMCDPGFGVLVGCSCHVHCSGAAAGERPRHDPLRPPGTGHRADSAVVPVIPRGQRRLRKGSKMFRTRFTGSSPRWASNRGLVKADHTTRAADRFVVQSGELSTVRRVAVRCTGRRGAGCADDTDHRGSAGSGRRECLTGHGRVVIRPPDRGDVPGWVP